MTDDTGRLPDVCANCGSDLIDGEWHPIRTSETEDGTDIHSFCDGDCLEAWIQ